MATPSKIKLSSTQNKGEFHAPGITEESAAKASEVLQENHDTHHILFNSSGMHNHVAHHILSIYALGASPSTIQQQYDNTKKLQRPFQPLDKGVLQDLNDPSKFKIYLGQAEHYYDFLIFFQNEMEKKGWQAVVNEYLLKGDEQADDLLVRMYAGFLHPIIHLGFGIEFQQPAIVAEALAQAAIHSTWIGDLFLPAEKAAAAASGSPSSKSLADLLDEIRQDEKLSTAAAWTDDNKIRDGILVRAPNEAIKYASQYTVRPDQLEEKTAEMINAAVYFTGGAQHPPKQIKFDFYYMHCVNCSIFFSTLLKQQSWLSTRNKCRLLEWKARNDLIMYASRRSPKPLLNEIINYKSPSDRQENKLKAWPELFENVSTHPDDGHASKLIRALAHGEVVSKPYQDKDAFRIRGDMWVKLGNMALDSVRDSGDTWVRSAGFEEAWVAFEDRPRL